MKYVILQLLLNAMTGQPLEIARYNTVEYATYEDCERSKDDIGPQSTKDGKVRVFSCGSEKQITAL